MTKFAAIQMASGPTVAANLLEADSLIAEAAQAGARVVALPENFAIMGESEFDKVHIREDDGVGLIQTFLSETAKKHGVWVIGGTVPLVADDEHKIRAACLTFNDQGERVNRYDKVHLFDVSVPGTDEEYRESNSIEPGHSEQVAQSPFGTLGFSICYDLRFPEYFRRLVGQGAQVIFVPSAFTSKTGAAHWEVLLRARAIENLCYIVAPNQGGFHTNGRQTYGHSMIIDPWGGVLDCHKVGKGMAIAEIDIERLSQTRASFPVLSHRKFYVEETP